jgi:peptide/nickel transport system substrate-binding protein
MAKPADRQEGSGQREGRIPPEGRQGTVARTGTVGRTGRGARDGRAGPRALRREVALAGVAAGLLLASCSSGSAPASATRSHGVPLPGGTATFAMSHGDQFNWILPLPNEASFEPYEQNTEYSMWRPLYFAGNGASPTIDQPESLAYPPAWSNGDRTVTIRLKPRHWSDGKPVTTRDVQFFFDLLEANKSQIATYIPGDLPDDVTSISYPSASTFVIRLKAAVNPTWFDDNELTFVVPLPQQAWDRTSATAPVGNYDLTPAGAKAVFHFLYGQSEKLSTYATNPLWKVVDGPWVLTGYSPTTATTTLTANPAYDGPDRPRLHRVVLESFPSETAEVDALRSGGLDYGYLPLSDAALAASFRASGFTVAPWNADYIQWAQLGYTSKTYGPLVRQVYLRQALQHLVDQPLYIAKAQHGYGSVNYGPVPDTAGSPYLTSEEATNPDPYSPGAARALLRAHGWRPGPGGVLTCAHPGTGAGQCGTGIARGAPLRLLFMYQTGSPSLTAEVEAYQSAAAGIGVDLVLDPQSLTTMYSIGGVCPPGPCNWGIILYANYFWDYGDPEVLPGAGQAFGPGNYWGGGYSSATADRLINGYHTEAGLAPLFAYENYISRQVAGLWFPSAPYQISVVKDTLREWQPQQVFGDPQPSRWYFVRG